MGYRIEVNHGRLRTKAKELHNIADSCVSHTHAVAQVSGYLRGNWTGQDATAFIQKLNAMDNPDAMLMKISQSLHQYADHMEAAAEAYTKAQADAINRTLLI